LLGDAADSPLVAEEGDADQIFFGLMTNYRF
jgi:outer membrane scaffolding protein for murein synthesis (MipA/OmpV family)